MSARTLIILASLILLAACEDGTRRIYPKDDTAVGGDSDVMLPDGDDLLTDAPLPDDDSVPLGDGDDLLRDGVPPVDEDDVFPPDDGTVLPDDGIVLPDDGIVLPDDGIVLPDDGIVLPDEDIVLPDDGIVLPDDGIVLPDDGIVLPDEDTTLPQTGRWDCLGNVCTPVYGDTGCGDGTCSPNSGESPVSCPADCFSFTTQNGEGQPCNDDIDCAFYAWSAGGVGYWTCQWSSGQDYCHAQVTSSYCGTGGYDYCYYGTSGIETPATCATDCLNKPIGSGNTGMQCDNDRDCIFLEWPPNNG